MQKKTYNAPAINVIFVESDDFLKISSYTVGDSPRQPIATDATLDPNTIIGYTEVVDNDEPEDLWDSFGD